MTVLRSREVLSAPKSLTPIKTPNSESIEPATPSKSIEHSNTPPIITPNSNPSTPSKPQIRSLPDLGTTARRRSLRLASVRDAGETAPNSLKVVENGGFGVGLSDNINVGDGAGSDFEKVGVEKTMMVDLNDEVVVVDLVSEDEKTEIGEVSDLKRFNQAIGKVVSEVKGWGKRKLGEEDHGLLSREKAYLNLRSGKKVSKMKMDGYSLMDGNEMGAENKYSERGLKGEFEEGDLKIEQNSDTSVGTGSLLRNFGLKEWVKGLDGSENVARKGYNAKKKGKQRAVDIDLSLNRNAGNVDMAELEKSPTIIGDCSVKARSGLSRRDKGKGKLDEDVSLSINFSPVALELEHGDAVRTPVSNVPNLVDNMPVQDESRNLHNIPRSRERDRRQNREERYRDIARRNASRFAHFPSEEVENVPATDEAENGMPRTGVAREMEDWPGPFSTAMKIIKDRQKAGIRPHQSSFLDTSKPAAVPWIPKSNQLPDRPVVSVPLLQDLCMGILAKNADAITSLDCVPDILRHKLCQLLCDSRRMNHHFLNILVRGAPAEIRIRDCSWLTEEQFTEAFGGCETNNLTV